MLTSSKMVSMNRLDSATRCRVVAALVEGNSIRSTVRMTGVAKNTIQKLLIELVAACSAYQDETLRHLSCNRSQVDECLAFCHAKHKNVTPEITANNPFPVDVWVGDAI